MEATKKLGRPSLNPKIVQKRVRMTREEADKLEFCAKKRNITQTDVINLGIDKVYQELIKKG